MKNQQKKNDELVKLVDASSKTANMQSTIREIIKNVSNVFKYIDGDRKIIEERLKKYPTIKDLERAISDSSVLNSFFVNEDGSEMKLIFPDNVKSEMTPGHIQDFKKETLIFLKNSQLSVGEFQNIVDQFEEEKSKIEEEMGTTVKDIAIEQLRFALEQKESNPESLGKNAEYLLSGFNFSRQIELFRKNPSIAKHTLEDFHDTDRITDFGARYRRTLNKGKTAATLIALITNSPDTSIEAEFLPPTKYKPGYENLFLFSLIRYFTMEYWDQNVRVMHAMTIALLQQFVDDELPEDLKSAYMENISTYLNTIMECASIK